MEWGILLSQDAENRGGVGMTKARIPFNFERVTRKFVEINCSKCSYPRGVKNEHGITKCGMCGTEQ